MGYIENTPTIWTKPPRPWRQYPKRRQSTSQEKCHQRHCKHDVNLNYITSDGLNKQSTTHFPQSECLSHRIAFLKRLKSRQLGRARRFSWCKISSSGHFKCHNWFRSYKILGLIWRLMVVKCHISYIFKSFSNPQFHFIKTKPKQFNLSYFFA